MIVIPQDHRTGEKNYSALWKSVTLHIPALDSRFTLSHLLFCGMSIISTMNLKERTAVERHWFTRVEFDGYSSGIVTHRCSQRNTMSCRFHRSLVHITLCQSAQTMQKICDDKSVCLNIMLGMRFALDRVTWLSVLWWTADAYVDWSSNLLLPPAEPWYQCICINDLPRLLNSVTVCHLFVKKLWSFQ